MFDFLKKKKEAEFDFNSVESSSDVSNESDEVKSSELGMPQRFEPSKPEIFNTQSSGNVTERDIQLILAKIELLNKRLDDFDAKISEVLEIARQSK